MEAKLLSIMLKSRESYQRIYSLLNQRLYSREFRELCKIITAYYQRDSEATYVDHAVIMELIATTYDNDKHITCFKLLIEEAVASETSAANVEATVIAAKRAELEQLIALSCVNKDGKLADLYKEWAALSSISTLDELRAMGATIIERIDLAVLVAERAERYNTIELMPRVVNERLDGGIMIGHHVTVFARPEMGKSLAVISMGSGAVRQGYRVLHIENEDRPADVQMRYISNLSGMTRREILNDPERAALLAENNGLEHITVAELTPGNPAQIGELVARYAPSLLIVNQLRNLSTGEQNRVISLENAAIACRNLGKTGKCAVISVTQAGDSAEGKAYLEMGDVDFSNCLAKGQLVRMHNGDIRAVETLLVGEQVMGMDGTPRTITRTGSGVANMFRIKHKDGRSYEVNEQHILTLKKTTAFAWIAPKGTVVDVPLSYVRNNPSALCHLKGLSVAVEYADKALPVDPYFLGLWLADGFKTKPEICTKDERIKDWLIEHAAHSGMTTSIRKSDRDGCYYVRLKDTSELRGQNKLVYRLKQLGVWGSKHIPHVYLTASRKQRLELLAGLIDGDGHYSSRAGNHYFEIAAHQFQNEIQDLCWGLGFKASMVGRNKVYVSGPLTQVPCKLRRKQATNDSTKEVLCSSISSESIGTGEYYGITVDGDQRYVLGNYIVTHNTGIPAQCDVLMGIGATPSMVAEGTRGISFPKNKLSDARDSHDPVIVKVRTDLSRMTSPSSRPASLDGS